MEIMIRGVCKGLGKAQDQPLHAWHCGRRMEMSRAVLLELFTSYLGSSKMGEMERKLQRWWLGLGLGVPVPCMAQVPACPILPSVMVRASPCPVRSLLHAAKQRCWKRLFEMAKP